MVFLTSADVFMKQRALHVGYLKFRVMFDRVLDPYSVKPLSVFEHTE